MAKLIQKTSKIIKSTCVKVKIKFPQQKINRIGKILTKYLCENTNHGYESKDRRFLLGKNCILIFQSRFRQINMPLNKVIASLSLNRTQLYSYVLKKPFSLNEKILIKNLIRLSDLRLQRSAIPCIKIRSLSR